MAEKDLNELFLDTLKNIYCAEKQILKALPHGIYALGQAESMQGQVGPDHA